MKILTQVDFTIITPADKQDGEGNDARDVIQLRSRRFEVLNTDDIAATLTKMADGIQAQIGNSYLQGSDIVLNEIEKLQFITTNRIQQGQGVILNYLNGCHQKKLVLILKMKITSVSNIVFNALF